MADVERDYSRCAVAEEDVRESPGRGSDIERRATRDGDAESAERMIQFEPAPADVGMIGLRAA